MAGQVGDDLVDGLRIGRHRLDNLVAQRRHGRDRGGGAHDAGALEEGEGGQHVVRTLRGGGELGGDDRLERDGVERFGRPCGVGPVAYGVALAEHRSLQSRAQAGLAACGARKREIAFSGGRCGGLPGGDEHRLVERVVSQPRRGGENEAAFLVEVSEQRVQEQKRADLLGAVGIARPERARPLQIDVAMRRGLGERAGDLLDLLGGDAGLLACPRGGVLGDGAGVVVEPVAVRFDERLVVQPVFHEEARDAQEERQLGSWLDGHPFGCERAEGAQARIDHVHSAPVLARLDDLLDLMWTDALVGRLVQQHDALRFACARRGVGSHDRGDDGGDVDVGERAFVVVVRGAEGAHEALGVVAVGAAAVLEPARALRARLLHVLSDVGKRLVPRDFLEAAGAVCLERRAHAVLGVGHLHIALPASAQIASRMRMLLQALRAHDGAILHVHGHAAEVAASRAQRGDALLFDVCASP